MPQNWKKLGPGILAVSLYNEEHENALYLSQDPHQRNALTFKIKNIGGSTAVLRGDHERGMLQFRFPAGLLNTEALPVPADLKVMAYKGVSGADLFDLEQLSNQVVLDGAQLNAATQLDINGLVTHLNNTKDELEAAASRGVLGSRIRSRSLQSRGLQSRSVGTRSVVGTESADLATLVERSNALKAEILATFKTLMQSEQVKRSPVLAQGVTQFAALFERFTALSTAVDDSLEAMHQLQQQLEEESQIVETAVAEYIKSELGEAIHAYFQSLEGQGLFDNNLKVSLKELLGGITDLQLNENLAAQLASPQPDAGTWLMALENGDAGEMTAYVWVHGQTEVTLAAGDYWTFTIDHLSVNYNGKSRTETLEIHYPQLTYPDVELESGIHAFSQAQIELINRSGQKHAPFQLSVIDGSLLLNDGQTTNRVVLRLLNLGQQPIYFKDVTLSLQYEVQREGLVAPFALTAKDDAVTATLVNSRRQGILNRNQSSAQFVKQPTGAAQVTYTHTIDGNQDYALRAGDFWLIVIDDIQTALPAGHAQIELAYQNIPEFWDGELAVTVQRTPLVMQANRVGIGTREPLAPLHLKGNHEMMRLEGQKAVQASWKRGDQRAALGFGESQTDFDLDYRDGNVNVNTDQQVLINRQVPIQFKRIQLTDTATVTDYPADEWNGAIVGWEWPEAVNADIPHLLRLTRHADGHWQVNCTEAQRNGTVDLMFVSKHFSTAFDWR